MAAAAAILRFYIDVAVPSFEATGDTVNLSVLLEASKSWSPVQLKYDNEDETVQNLAAVAIINFCKSYEHMESFGRRGMERFTEIVTGSTDIPDSVARQIFLLHITKRKIHPAYFGVLASNTNMMKVKIIPSPNEKMWILLARKAIRHSQINRIIDDSLADIGLTLTPDDVEEEASLKVTLVEGNNIHLRGFVGINEIFIHVDNFQRKIGHFEGDDVDLREIIAKMDIISVCIHEFAHLKIRKCVGDFNMHTPIIVQNKDSTITPEFGVHIEKTIFGNQLDWFGSQHSLRDSDIQHMEKFINAIECGTELPPGFVRGAFPRLQDSSIEGADIEIERCIC